MISKDTILVDSRLKDSNIGRYNHTIFHECAHKLLHYKVYQFQKIVKKKYDSICTIDNKHYVSIIEHQAKRLAACLQLAAKRVSERAKKIINQLLVRDNTVNENEVMEEAITILADVQASKQSVKIRLSNLGFESAVGTFTYVDDHLVLNHSKFVKKEIRTIIQR